MGWIGKLVNKHSLAATALVTSLIVTGLLPAAPAVATDGQSSPSDEASSSVESAKSGEKTSLDLGVAIDTLNKSVLPAVTAAQDASAADPSADGSLVTDDALGQTAGASANDSEAPESSDKPASQTVETADLRNQECMPWDTDNPLTDYGYTTNQGRWIDNNVNIYADQDLYLKNHEGEGLVVVGRDMYLKPEDKESWWYRLGFAQGGSGAIPDKDEWMLIVKRNIISDYDFYVEHHPGPKLSVGHEAYPWWGKYYRQNEKSVGYGPDLRVENPDRLQWSYNGSPENGYKASITKFNNDVAKLPTNGEVSTSGNTLQLKGDGSTPIQVFELDMNDSSVSNLLQSNNTTLDFTGIPESSDRNKDGRIILNLVGPSNITIATDFDINLNGRRINRPGPDINDWGGGLTDWGNLTRKLLWRFPDASKVNIGSSTNDMYQFTGSIFAANDRVDMHIWASTNGRVISFNDLTFHDGGSRAGLEFHSFPFDLPSLECMPNPPTIEVPGGKFTLEKELDVDGVSSSDLNQFKGYKFTVKAHVTTPAGATGTDTYEVEYGKTTTSKWYPEGTKITFEEVEPLNAPDGFKFLDWKIDPSSITIGDDGDGAPGINIVVTNTYEQEQYPFHLVKKFEGIESGDQGKFNGLSFEVKARVECGSYSYPWVYLTVKGDGSVTTSDEKYPAKRNGSYCKVSVDEVTPSNTPDGYTWEGSTYRGEYYIGDNTAAYPVEITNTYKLLSKTADIAIKKLTKSADGWQYSAASDWELKAEVITSGVTQSPSKNEYVTSGADGYSRWTVDFNGKTSAKVRFSEKQQFGYRLDDIRCTVRRDGSYIDLPNGGQVTPEEYEANGGYGELEFQPGDEVDCWIWNEQYADMDLNKKMNTTPGATGNWTASQPNSVANAWYLKAEVDSASASKGGGVKYIKSGDNKEYAASSGFYPAMGTYAFNRWQLDFGSNEEMTLTLTEKAPTNGAGALTFHSGTCEITHANGNKETFTASTNPWTVKVKRGDKGISCDFNNWTPKDDEGSINLTKQVCDYNQTSDCPTVDWKVGLEKVSGDLNVTPKKAASGGVWSTAGGGAAWTTKGKSTDTAKVKIWEGVGTGDYATASYKSVKCTGQDGTVFLNESGGTMPNSSSNALTFDKDVKASDNITCTFVNEKPEEKTAEITVYKELCEYGASTSGCPKANWTVGLATASGDLKITASTKPTNGATGATWQVSGPIGAKAKLKLWEINGVTNSTFKSLVCTNQNGKTLLNKSGGTMPTSEGTALTFTEDISAGDKVTCTFVNQKPQTVIPNDSGSIVFQKQTTINGGNPVNAQNWELKLVPVTEGVSITTTSPTNGKTGSDGKLTWGLSFPQGTTKAKFKISEVKQDPYSIADVTCDGKTVSTSAIEGGGVEVELPVKDSGITCTFTNNKTENPPPPTTESVATRIWMKKYFCDANGNNCTLQNPWKVGLDLDPNPQTGVTGFGGGTQTLDPDHQWNFKAPKGQEISFVLWEPEAGSKNFQSLKCGVRDFESGSYSSYVSIGSGNTVTVGGKSYPGTKFTMKGGQELDCHLNNTEKVVEPTKKPSTITITKEDHTNGDASKDITFPEWTVGVTKGDTKDWMITPAGAQTANPGGSRKDVIWDVSAVEGETITVNLWEEQSETNPLDFRKLDCSGQISLVLPSNGKMPTEDNPAKATVKAGTALRCYFHNYKPTTPPPTVETTPSSIEILKEDASTTPVSYPEWKVGVKLSAGASPDASIDTPDEKTANPNNKQQAATWKVNIPTGKQLQIDLWEVQRTSNPLPFKDLWCKVGNGTEQKIASGTIPSKTSPAKLTVSAGQNVTCRFVNGEPKDPDPKFAYLYMYKQVPNGQGGYDYPEWKVGAKQYSSVTDVIFQGSGAEKESQGPNNPAKWNIQFNDSSKTIKAQVWEAAAPVSPDGNTYTYDSFKCTNKAGTTIASGKAPTAMPSKTSPAPTNGFNVTPGEEITCVFTNNKKETTPQNDFAQIQIQKFVGSKGKQWNLQATTDAKGYTQPGAYGDHKQGNGWAESDLDGIASWKVYFNGSNTSTDVTIREENRDGYRLSSGSCIVWDADDNESTHVIKPSNPEGDWSFKIPVSIGKGAFVKCELTNEEYTPPPNLEKGKIELAKAIYAWPEGQDDWSKLAWSKDWKLRLTPVTSDVTVSPDANSKDQGWQVAGSSGAGTASWDVNYPAGLDKVTFGIEEEDRPGWYFSSVTCKYNDEKGTELTVNKTGTPWTIDVETSRLKAGEKVNCQYNNRQNKPAAKPAQIVLRKIVQSAAEGSFHAQDGWCVNLESATDQVSATKKENGGNKDCKPGYVLTKSTVKHDGKDVVGATWEVDFGDKDSADFKLFEQQKDGHKHYNTECKINDGTFKSVGNSSTTTGATLSGVKPGDKVDCRISNQTLVSTVSLVKEDHTYGDVSGVIRFPEWKVGVKAPAGTTGWSITDPGEKTSNAGNKPDNTTDSKPATWQLNAVPGSNVTLNFWEDKPATDLEFQKLVCQTKSKGTWTVPTSSWPTAESPASVTISAGEDIKCWFHNAGEPDPEPGTGKLYVKKEVCDEKGLNCTRQNWNVGLTPDPSQAGITIKPATTVNPDGTMPTGTSTTYPVNGATWNIDYANKKVPARVQIWEAPTAEQKAANKFKSLQCWTNSGKYLLDIKAGEGGMPTKDNPSPFFDVPAGDNVTCVFTNQPPTESELRVHKQRCEAGVCKEVQWNVGLKQVDPLGETTVIPNYNPSSNEGSTGGNYKRWNVKGPKDGVATVVLWEGDPITGTSNNSPADAKDLVFQDLVCEYADAVPAGASKTLFTHVGNMPTADAPTEPFQVRAGYQIDCYINNKVKAEYQPAEIVITKKLYNGPFGQGGTVTNPVWYTKATTSTTGVTIKNKVGTASTDGWYKTATRGETQWTLDFGTKPSANVTISEKSEDGYELTSWSCETIVDGKPEYNVGTLKPGTKQIDIELLMLAGTVKGAGQRISCTFENSPLPELEAEKKTSPLPGGSDNEADWGKPLESWQMNLEIRDQKAIDNGAKVTALTECDGAPTVDGTDGTYTSKGEDKACVRWRINFGDLDEMRQFKNQKLEVWVSEKGQPGYLFYQAKCTIKASGKPDEVWTVNRVGDAETDKEVPLTLKPGTTSVQCTFKNAQPGGGLEWSKLGQTEDDTFSPLSGSVWQVLNEWGTAPIEGFERIEGAGCSTLACTNQFKALGLKPGKYVLREIEAPVGYEVVEDTDVTIVDGQISKPQPLGAFKDMRKIGPEGPTLPMAGGVGTLIFMSIAGGSIVLAVILAVPARKRRGRHA